MDKKSYAFGMSLAGNLLQSGVHGLNFDDFVAGLKAMMQGEELAISMDEAGVALEQFYKIKFYLLLFWMRGIWPGFIHTQKRPGPAGSGTAAESNY